MASVWVERECESQTSGDSEQNANLLYTVLEIVGM